MVGIGDILHWGGRAISTPATAGAGFSSGLLKFMDKDLDPENKLGYKDPFTGFLHGITNPRQAANVGDKLAGDYNSDDNPGLVKALGYGLNIVQDPLTYAGYAGPAAKALGVGGKLGEAAEAAGTASKLGEGAGLGSKGAQALRRFGTGTRLAAGNPAGGLIWATAGTKLEPKVAGIVSPRLEAISGALAKRTASKTPGVAESAVASATPAVEHVAESAVAPGLKEAQDTVAKAVGEYESRQFSDQLLHAVGETPEQVTKAQDLDWVSQVERMANPQPPRFLQVPFPTMSS